VLGNAIVQLIALGELQSVADGRALLSQQSEIKVYEPKNTAAWDAAFARFKGLGQTS